MAWWFAALCPREVGGAVFGGTAAAQQRARVPFRVRAPGSRPHHPVLWVSAPRTLFMDRAPPGCFVPAIKNPFHYNVRQTRAASMVILLSFFC